MRKEGEHDLDLQFVVASGAIIDHDELVLKNGGYVLQCDSWKPTVKIERYANNKSEEVEPTKVENDELYIYELSVKKNKVSTLSFGMDF